MERFDFFEEPAQVKFWESGSYRQGIAFHDSIISIDTGAIYSIPHIYKFAVVAEPLIVYHDAWIPMEF